MTRKVLLVIAFLAIAAAFVPRHADAVAWNSLRAGNPVLPGYFADPCVRKFGDTYYLYVTPDGWDVGRGPFCIWTSKDFVHWTSHKSPGSIPGTFWPSTDFKWAPSVIKHNGKYYMYNQTPCMIWGAVSDTPLGPWTSLSEPGKPMIPDQTPKGSIVLDGEIFIDSDGQRYMWYSTWWTPTVAKMKDDMATIDGDPIQYFENGRNPGYKAPYGTVQGCMEAPYMFKHNGTYYLMYSDNFCQDSSYQVKYSYSKSPVGPFTYGKNNPILSTSDDGTVDGPGHHTMLEDNGKIYIVYHRHDNPHAADGAHRQTAIDELRFAPDGSIEKVIPTHTGVGYLAPSTVRDTNIALGKPATASSYASADFVPGYAMDENNGTLWKASEYKYPQWLTVDIGKPHKIVRAETEFQFAQVGYKYVIESSNDGKAWKKFVDRSKNTDWGPTIDKGSATARYFRITLLGDDSPQRPAPEVAIWNFKLYDGINKPNQAPVVNAGADKSASSAFRTLPLVGIVTDDGLPKGPITTMWKQVSGPGKVIIVNPERRETSVTFPGEGKYVLKLTASDGQYTSGDTVTYTIKPLGDKLISYNFDETGSTAVDASGNLQDAFLKSNATRGTGVTGTALLLNGMGAFLDVPALGKPGKLTVAAWIKPDALSNASSIFCGNNLPAGASGAPKLFLNGSGQIQLTIPGSQPVDQTSDFRFNDNSLGTWTHVAADYDPVAKTVKFFVNGRLDSVRNYDSAVPVDLSAGVRIGAWSNGQYFDGKIDSLGVWNRALGDAEVAGLSSGVKWVSVADACKMADGTKVTLKAKAVTYAQRDSTGKRDTNYFYIAEPDNTAVLRVEDGAVGQDNADTETGATLTGIIRASSKTGEKYLELTAPLEIESCAPVAAATTEAALTGHDAFVGKLITFEDKVASVSEDGKSLKLANGMNAYSAEPVRLVGSGNTVVVTGVVGMAGTKADGKTLLLRDVRRIAPAVPPVREGLLASYQFNEKNGSVVPDASESGNDATLGGGAVWASGRLGNAISLDGRGGHVTLPQGIMQNLKDFTVTTWLKLDNAPTFSRIFDFGSGNIRYMMLCNLGEGRLRYAITLKGNGEDGEKVCDTNPVLTMGAWKHVAVVGTGTDVAIYVDGVQVAQNNVRLIPSDLGATTQNWIGRSQYGDPTLDGKVDDFRIYNRALSADEIKQIAAGY